MAKEELVAYFYRWRGLAEKYRRSEEALRLDEARLEALLTLSEMPATSEEDIVAYALEEAIRLTGSRIGWMGALSPDERTLTMHSWSKGTREECGILDHPHSISIEGGGLWVEPVLRRRPVIVNAFPERSKKSVPYGHIPVRRFMGVPVYDGERILAVAEVGNKISDYEPADLRQLSLLMSGVWRIILRKRAEETLSESKARAELYVDLMGHDINNMNQVAMGFLELALDKLDMAGRLEDCDRPLLEKPMDALRHSAKLIDNVKKLQRLRAGLLPPAVFDLGSVLSEVYDDIVRRNEPGIRIDYRPAGACFVEANELLKDVFTIIVDNSIKHSSPGSQLAIRMRIIPLENVYRVTIEDDGPGIPDARKAALFDRLSPGKSKPLRTGFGLGLAKTLVESYRGHIGVEDRIPGDHRHGCRFIVELPTAGRRPSVEKDTTRIP